MLFPVLTLTDHQPHGDGLVAFSFISQLARRGHEVHVIAQDVDIRSELPTNLHIHHVGVGTRGIRQRLSFLIGSRRVVRRLQRTETIDLIHQLNPVTTGMSLGVIGLGIPLVLGTFVAKWSFKAANPEVFKKLFQQPKATVLAAHFLGRCAQFFVLLLQEYFASAFLVTTRAALSRFSSAKRVADRVHWIAHGVDVQLFSPKSSSGVGNDISFVGTVSVHKGILTLLDAFELVAAKLPNATLTIAGATSRRDIVSRRISEILAFPNVSLRGRLDRKAVSELIARSSVYCQPSFGEPYGMAVLEAMACGKPVVVTDCGGLAELVDDDGGRRVKAGDPEALAAALIEILSSPQLQRTMGAHNREVAERVYDWPQIVEKLEAVYSEVIRQSRSRARSSRSHLGRLTSMI